MWEVEDTWKKSFSLNDTDAAVVVSDFKIRLIGVLGSAAGRRKVSIQGPARLSVSELIENLLSEVDNRQFRELLVDSATNNPLPNVIILLNDQDCNLFQGLGTKLDAGTVVTIIPVAHGG